MCTCAQSLQSCLTLCHPMKLSPVGSSVHEIFSTRILEWSAIPSSKWSSQIRGWTRVSFVSCLVGGFFTAEPLIKPPCSLHFNLLEPINLLFFFLKPVWVGSSITYRPGYSPLKCRNWDTKTEVHLCQFKPRGHLMCPMFTGILLNQKNKWNWVICGDLDGSRIYHTEWSKSEREKQISYIKCIYVESRKMVYARQWDCWGVW